MAKTKSATRVYIAFSKEDLAPSCKKLGAEYAKTSALNLQAKLAYLKDIEANHGDVIKAAAPAGLEYIETNLNFDRLQGVYDVPGATATKSDKKALRLK